MPLRAWWWFKKNTSCIHVSLIYTVYSSYDENNSVKYIKLFSSLLLLLYNIKWWNSKSSLLILTYVVQKSFVLHGNFIMSFSAIYLHGNKVQPRKKSSCLIRFYLIIKMSFEDQKIDAKRVRAWMYNDFSSHCNSIEINRNGQKSMFIHICWWKKNCEFKVPFDETFLALK